LRWAPGVKPSTSARSGVSFVLSDSLPIPPIPPLDRGGFVRQTSIFPSAEDGATLDELAAAAVPNMHHTDVASRRPCQHLPPKPSPKLSGTLYDLR
jgi:hypothetical protein